MSLALWETIHDVTPIYLLQSALLYPCTSQSLNMSQPRVLLFGLGAYVDLAHHWSIYDLSPSLLRQNRICIRVHSPLVQQVFHKCGSQI
jgi:hypothetical protein